MSSNQSENSQPISQGELLSFLRDTTLNEKHKNLSYIEHLPALVQKAQALLGDDYDPAVAPSLQIAEFFKQNPDISPVILLVDNHKIPEIVERARQERAQGNPAGSNVPERGFLTPGTAATVMDTGAMFTKTSTGLALRAGANILTAGEDKKQKITQLERQAASLHMDLYEYIDSSSIAKKAYDGLNNLATHAVGHSIASTVGSTGGAVVLSPVPVVGSLGGTYLGDMAGGEIYNLFAGRKPDVVIDRTDALLDKWENNMDPRDSQRDSMVASDVDPIPPTLPFPTKNGGRNKRGAA